MTALRKRLARLHLVWLWFLGCAGVVVISQVTGAGMLDGGLGSALFGLLFLVGAPFIIIGRLGVAATTWAPPWLQAVLSIALVLVATALADHFVTRWLARPEANESSLQ